jgi:F-type H+-transporting ATPase subunit a
VLAVRLFANMMAGHLVLAVIVAFIGATYGSWVHYMVVPASVMGATAISVLELFVAFLQAYVFTFLAALFISSATHHH